MTLSALIYQMPADLLQSIAQSHLGSGHHSIESLESTLRSYQTIKSSIHKCPPPAFLLLKRLLFGPSAGVPRDELTLATRDEICALDNNIAEGWILGRGYDLELYQKVLKEARRSGLEIDPAEDSILGVLRTELELSLPEHFLSEFHPEFRELWGSPHEQIESCLAKMLSFGLIFEVDGIIVLPQEVRSGVRTCLGLELSERDHLRLMNMLSNHDLNLAETILGVAIRGDKAEKAAFIVRNFVSPQAHLSLLSNESLRDICRELNANTSGTKESIVARIVETIALGPDAVKDEVDEIQLEPREERALSEQKFKALFMQFKGYQISEMLCSINRARRTTGSKSSKVAYMWELEISETRFLSQLKNEVLDRALWKLELKTSGSKNDKISRLVEFARSNDLEIEEDESDTAARVSG